MHKFSGENHYKRYLNKKNIQCSRTFSSCSITSSIVIMPTTSSSLVKLGSGSSLICRISESNFSDHLLLFEVSLREALELPGKPFNFLSDLLLVLNPISWGWLSPYMFSLTSLTELKFVGGNYSRNKEN